MQETNDSSQNPQHMVESTDSSSIDVIFKKGVLAYEKNDINTAIDIFQSIVETNPDYIEAYINLGDAYFKLNKVNEAINYWKKALSQDPKQVLCYLNIGNAYYSMNNIDNALPYWHIAITMAPDNIKALRNLGAAYEKLGDKLNAFKYYEQYLNYSSRQNDQGYDTIFKKVTYSKRISLDCLNEGIKYQKEQNYRKATSYYIKSLKIYPNYSKAHLNLGNICYRANKLEHAAHYWHQTIKLDPTEETVYCNLGVVYEKLNQYDNAYCLYSRFVNITKKHTIDVLNVKKRMEQLKKYLDKYPKLAQKQFDQAEKHYKNKKYYEALWKYENYAILKPDQSSAYEYKITELKNIVDPVKKVTTDMYELGNKYVEAKDYEMAIQAYRRCLRLDPKGKYSDIAYKKILDCTKILGKKIKLQEDEQE